jgi:hypothetical protein
MRGLPAARGVAGSPTRSPWTGSVDGAATPPEAVLGVLAVQVDLLETCPGDPVKGIGVVSEPLGFVTRFREYQPVFHLHLGHDLSQAAEDLLR